MPTDLAQQGSATNGGTVEITGTGDADGDMITLYNGTTMIGSGTAGLDGAFDITTTATFADSTYYLTATDTSADGTVTSAASDPVTACVYSRPTLSNAQASVGYGSAPIALSPNPVAADPDGDNLTARRWWCQAASAATATC
jgi:hypothetical protein